MGVSDWLLCITGGLLIFLCLLTESGEKRLQSWLENTWIHLDDVHNQAVTRHAAFMHKVAATTSAILDALFGRRLLSLRAVAISATLGLAMFLLLAWTWVNLLEWQLDIQPTLLAQWNAGKPGQIHLLVMLGKTLAWFAGYVVFVLAILPAILKPMGIKVWGVLLLVFWVYTASHCGVTEAKDGSLEPSPYFLSLLAGAACDIAFIAGARWLFRHMQTTSTLPRAVGLGIAGLVLALAVVAAPLAGAFGLIQMSQTTATALALTAFTNVLDVAVMVVPLLLLLLLIVHRIVWPVVKGPLYTVQRHHVFERYKKAVVGLGVALIAYSALGLPKWVEHLIGLT